MSPAQIADKLESVSSSIPGMPVVTGFDGFVDEMITVVDQRKSLEEFRRVEDISQFGQLISAAAGHSSLREIVVTQADPGGCAVNMGDGLVTLGLPVTTFATVGTPIHSAFANYAKKANLISWGREPGRTLAFEFADGKLMFSAVSQLAEFTPHDVAQRLLDGSYLAACQSARLIALTDWTLYPHMTACWNLLIDKVYSKLTHKPYFFLDLVDPSSRSEEDINDMLNMLHRFNSCGYTILGLNQNEANIISRLKGIPIATSATPETSQTQATHIRIALDIDEVVIHAQKFAVSAAVQGQGSALGPFCPAPKKSTGAGDRFNAGFALGKLLHLPLDDQLLLATAVSGLYVRMGQSPNLKELIAFLRNWPQAV